MLKVNQVPYFHIPPSLVQSRNENAVTFYAEGGHHGRANSTGNEADVAGDEVVEEDKLEDIEDGSKFNPA